MREGAGSGPRWVLRRVAKTALAFSLRAAGAHRVVTAMRRREAGGGRVLVLSYHRVTPDFRESAREVLPSLLVSTATLRRQLEQAGRTYDLVSLDDAVRILREPRGTRGADVATVTFDDGYADNHHVALPVLSAMHVRATVFVATGFTGTERRLTHDRLFACLTELARRRVPLRRAGLDAPVQALLDACAQPGPAATMDLLIRRLAHPALLRVAEALERRTGIAEQELPAGSRLLGWDEIRALDAAGVAIGGHSASHAVLPNLPLDEARREIAACREAIAERLGRPPRHFAYPNGYHSPAVRRAVQEAGFDTGLTTDDRENARGAALDAIRRKVMWENTTLGLGGYSPSLAACSFAGVFHTLGLARAVSGERPDSTGDGRAGDGTDDDAGAARAVS